MMQEYDFYQKVEEDILKYLPGEYALAEISLTTQVKENDAQKTAISIRQPDEAATPIIYLDGCYEQYTNGRDYDDIMRELAQARINAMDGPIKALDPASLRDYEFIRPKLQMRIYDTEKNQKRLENIVHHSFGDFSCGYCILLESNNEKSVSAMVTPAMMETWGISKKRLHDDTILADLSRGPVLSTMQEMMDGMFSNQKPHNYLDTPEQQLPDQSEDVPLMLCLTNESCMNGAGLILNPVVQEKIANLLGSNYYVLPSSLHEVLIIPDGGNRETLNAEYLGYMVHEINVSTVSPSDLLSDKVEYYDAKSRTLTNAAAYERQHDLAPERPKSKTL